MVFINDYDGLMYADALISYANPIETRIYVI